MPLSFSFSEQPAHLPVFPISFENMKVWCRWIGLPEDKKFDTDCRNFPMKLYIRWRAVKRNSCLKHLISYYLEMEVLSEAITLNRWRCIAQHNHQQHIMDIIAMNNWNCFPQSLHYLHLFEQHDNNVRGKKNSLWIFNNNILHLYDVLYFGSEVLWIIMNKWVPQEVLWQQVKLTIPISQFKNQSTWEIQGLVQCMSLSLYEKEITELLNLLLSSAVRSYFTHSVKKGEIKIKM